MAGERFRFFNQIRITRSIDSVDSVTLTAPKTGLFKPFSFDSIQCTVGGAPLFTGIQVGYAPQITENQKSVSINAYSLPGVLMDCSAPVSIGSLEFNNQNLTQIADKLIAPFGLEAVVESGSIGALFDTVSADPSAKVWDFIARLATQRGLIVGSTKAGQLAFRAPEQAAPVAVFEQGQPPLVSVSPQFNEQAYFSHVTGSSAPAAPESAIQRTEKNQFLTNVLRPHYFLANDTGAAALPDAVRAKAARMFANVASYTIEVAAWRNKSGELWEPGQVVKLTAPDAAINVPYDFMIRSVTFNKTESRKTAVLNLIFPNSFAGKMPESLPWVDSQSFKLNWSHCKS